MLHLSWGIIIYILSIKIPESSPCHSSRDYTESDTISSGCWWMGMEVPNMRFKCIYDALEHLNILLYIVMEELNRLLHFRVSESGSRQSRRDLKSVTWLSRVLLAPPLRLWKLKIETPQNGFYFHGPCPEDDSVLLVSSMEELEFPAMRNVSWRKVSHVQICKP